MDHDWEALAKGLDRRIEACAGLPFQVRGVPHVRLSDPFTGGRVLLNPARRTRTRPPATPGAAGCPYCQGRTPPTLCYVRAAGGAAASPRAAGHERADAPAAPGDGRLVVEDEGESLAVAADSVRRGRADTWALLDDLAAATRIGAGGEPVPVVHPAEPWSARVFLNATPIVVDPGSPANGFVVSVPSPHHSLDLAPLAPPDGGDHATARPVAPLPAARTPAALPPAAVQAVLACWALLEAWADYRGLAPVPFVNGGKDRASGQSVECFHGQLIALGPDDRPPLSETIAGGSGAGPGSGGTVGRCPVCSLSNDEAHLVARVGDVVVAMHPAPRVECTLIVAPVVHVSRLAGTCDLGDLSIALSVAAHCLADMLGGLPPYNLAVRTGRGAGHLHLELVPRARVTVVGGFELATGFSVLARDPRKLAHACRAALPGILAAVASGCAPSPSGSRPSGSG